MENINYIYINGGLYLYGNKAYNGGGIYLKKYKVLDCYSFNTKHFINNKAINKGGAIYIVY